MRFNKVSVRHACELLVQDHPVLADALAYLEKRGLHDPALIARFRLAACRA